MRFRTFHMVGAAFAMTLALTACEVVPPQPKVREAAPAAPAPAAARAAPRRAAPAAPRADSAPKQVAPAAADTPAPSEAVDYCKVNPFHHTCKQGDGSSGGGGGGWS